ncbi:MAG: hypothetical protein WAU47_00235, partial [Desulfobaccales bacterium]
DLSPGREALDGSALRRLQQHAQNQDIVRHDGAPDILPEAGPPVSANALTVFTDKAAWASAHGKEVMVEDFNDKKLNDGLSYIGSESAKIANGYFHDSLKSTSQNAPGTTWYFDPAKIGGNFIAYGGDWDLGGPGGSGNSLKVYMNDLENPDVYTYIGSLLSGVEGFQFWGFISEAKFTSVRLIGGLGDNQQTYKLDNMSFSHAPLPGTFWMVSGGLLGLLALRRQFF